MKHIVSQPKLISLLTGTILLSPFICWGNIVSTALAPKILFLGVILLISLILLVFSGVKISRREYRGAAIAASVGVLFCLGNIAISGDAWMSFIGSTERMMGWITYISIGIFAWIVCSVFRKSITLEKIFTLTAWCGYILALIAICQRFSIPLGSTIDSMIFDGRAMATIGQYNTLGAFLVLAMGCHWMMLGRSLWRHIWIIILLAGIWATKSDIAIAGAVLILAISVFRSVRKVWIVTGFLILFLLGIFAIPHLPESSRASLESRKMLYQDAVREISHFSIGEHIIGRGADQVTPTLLRSFSPKYLAFENVDTIPDRTHNTILDVYIQFGILGTIFMLFVLLCIPLWLFFRGDKRISLLGGILLIHFGVNLVGFYDPTNLLFVALIIGHVFLGKIYLKEDNKTVNVSILAVMGAIIICFLLALLARDVTEQKNFIRITGERDDVFALMTDQDDLSEIQNWRRGDLAAKVLALQLSDYENIPAINQTTIDEICESNNYHIIQVCMRYYFLKNNFSTLEPLLQKMGELAPLDPIAMSLRAELATFREDDDKANLLFRQLLDLFPDFVVQPVESLTEYQQKKRQKIREHYPISEWEKTVQEK